MAKNAPKPKKKTSPLVWVGAAVVAFGAYSLLTGGDEPTAAATKKTKKAAGSKADLLYTPADQTAKFQPVSYNAKDVFNPLIKKAIRATVIKDSTGGKGIAPQLTGGEANWYYTGVTELDGVRQALLENTVSGETAYVGVGDAWKAAKIVSIDVGVIEMNGPNGASFKVPITPYGDVPGVNTPAPAILAGGLPQPLNVPGAALNGAIGNGLGVRPVGGPQANVAPGNGPAMAQNQADPTMPADNSNNNGNGRNRRNRRNRNNNQDPQGFNNVP